MICQPKSGTNHRSVWETARQLGLYGFTDAELEALIQLHDGSALRDQVAAEAAHYIRRLRNGMAKGDAC